MKWMPVSIERLRLWLLVLAGLLAAGILAIFGYARWQARHIIHDLPAKLGVSIERSTNGFSVSKSNGKRTVFSLDASKMVQYKGGGQVALQGVSLTLYGADGAPADHIYGADFWYDPVGEIVRANGAVQIDLQTLAQGASPLAAGKAAGRNVVHARTSDLVFNQKTGLATTSQRIDFSIAGATGSATGASFDAHTGMCILDRDVALDSNLHGNPLAVRARHAQFDRAIRRLYLLSASADYDSSLTTSDQATVSFRPDGSAYRIDLQGHVRISKDVQKVTSPSARVDLDAKSQPQTVLLSGGVLYTADEAARHLHGSAVSGVLSFGPQAAIRHAQMKNAVSIVDEETAPAASPGAKDAKPSQWTSREVEASQIDVDFYPGPGRQSIAQQILAQGGAALKVRTLYAASPAQETQVSGDQLFATLHNGVALDTLRGTGHTKLVLTNPNGVTQTSTGNNLRMSFASATTAKPAGIQPAASLESAEQEGNVILVQQTPKINTLPAASKSSNAAPGRASFAVSGEFRATAQRATYDGAADRIHLYGGTPPGASGAGISINPEIQEAGGALSATAIEFERATGNATAIGDVKATYRQTSGESSSVSFGGAGPVHVIAARAYLDHGKDLTIFYGDSAADARLWQGADSISAPVLELSGSERTLYAHGAGESGVKAVTAVLAGMGRSGESAPPDKPGQNSVVRVSSRTLLYSDPNSEAQLRGGVVMQDASGAVRSDAMDVYFGAVTGPGQAGASGAKQVDRVVARGSVHLEQPGRNGTGNELVYTANDRKFVLTGTSAVPPRLIDQTRGTVTGNSLIFNDRDDSVIVSGGPSRAVTDTRSGK